MAAIYRHTCSLLFCCIVALGEHMVVPGPEFLQQHPVLILQGRNMHPLTSGPQKLRDDMHSEEAALL